MLAQSVEQLAFNQLVTGSNPVQPTIYFKINSLQKQNTYNKLNNAICYLLNIYIFLRILYKENIYGNSSLVLVSNLSVSLILVKIIGQSRLRCSDIICRHAPHGDIAFSVSATTAS